MVIYSLALQVGREIMGQMRKKAHQDDPLQFLSRTTVHPGALSAPPAPLVGTPRCREATNLRRGIWFHQIARRDEDRISVNLDIFWSVANWSSQRTSNN